jgi:uncharacterized membrane protein YphA (DoxX/SURF4 family)
MTRHLPGLARLALGLVFIVAAWPKIARPVDFLAAIHGHGLPLPGAAALLLAIWLPWLELAAGALLLAGVWRDAALLLAGGLLAVFTLVSAQAWWRGIDVACGCFGTAEGLNASPAITTVRAAALLALAIYSWRACDWSLHAVSSSAATKP